MLLFAPQELACECLELFDELVECEVSVLVPHIKLVIQFCLDVSRSWV